MRPDDVIRHDGIVEFAHVSRLLQTGIVGVGVVQLLFDGTAGRTIALEEVICLRANWTSSGVLYGASYGLVDWALPKAVDVEVEGRLAPRILLLAGTKCRSGIGDRVKIEHDRRNC